MLKGLSYLGTLLRRLCVNALESCLEVSSVMIPGTCPPLLALCFDITATARADKVDKIALSNIKFSVLRKTHFQLWQGLLWNQQTLLLPNLSATNLSEPTNISRMSGIQVADVDVKNQGYFFVSLSLLKRSVTTATHVIRGDEPRHLCGGRQLSVDEALDLGLGPAVVNVHDGKHEPLSWLELVFDTVLVTLALHLHRRQHQTVAHEVSTVANSLGGLKAGRKK